MEDAWYGGIKKATSAGMKRSRKSDFMLSGVDDMIAPSDARPGSARAMHCSVMMVVLWENA